MSHGPICSRFEANFHGQDTRCSTPAGARYSMLTVAEPLAVVPPPQAAATLCHVDLYVVGSRQIFTAKILDVVCCKITTKTYPQNKKINLLTV